MKNDINFKDMNPVETINKIKCILNNINVEVREDYRKHLDGLYSASIICDDYGFFSNGKGITREYALASGYAEFMERLQTKSLYRRCYKFGDEEFNFFPDERDTVEVGYDENLFNVLVEDNSNNSLNFDKFIQYNNLLQEHTKSRSVKFTSFPSNECFWIPNDILSLCYGSNGMVAGNSFNEAAIQGLSEIFERYVNMLVLEKEVEQHPVDLDSNLIENYIIETIKNINASTNYNLQFIDLSCTGYPVIGLKCYDTVNKGFLVKFASHFNINIAIQRTITELFQGGNGKDVYNMVSSDTMVYVKEKRINRKRIFIDGRGSYPLSFLKKAECQASIGNVWFNDITDNRDGLDLFLNILKINNKKLYYRDYSYLNFNTYHIIVPGLSEMNLINDQEIKELRLHIIFRKTIKNLGYASDEYLRKICEYLDYISAGSKDTIGSLLDVPLKHTFTFYRISSLQIRLMIYIKLSEYAKALSIIRKHIKLSQSDSLSSKEYYLCLKDMLVNLVQYENRDDNKLDDIGLYLSQFYSETIVKKVIQLFKNQQEIFKSMPILTCPNCKECEYNKYCNSMKIKQLDKRLNLEFMNMKGYNERTII